LYALFVDDDVNSEAARSWHRRNADLLITTDCVLDELLALLRTRGHRRKAILVGAKLYTRVPGIPHLLAGVRARLLAALARRTTA